MIHFTLACQERAGSKTRSRSQNNNKLKKKKQKKRISFSTEKSCLISSSTTGISQHVNAALEEFESGVLNLDLTEFYKEIRKTDLKKSSNKLRMKALVVWDIHYQFLKLIYFIVFFTKIKHDMDKEEKTQMSL